MNLDLAVTLLMLAASIAMFVINRPAWTQSRSS
jgi:hypothetical protein